MIIEKIKAIIWPREKVDKFHRYVIVGMIVTDKPIEQFEGKNELVLEGFCFGLTDAIKDVVNREPNIKTGDASNVLLSLKEL